MINGFDVLTEVSSYKDTKIPLSFEDTCPIISSKGKAVGFRNQDKTICWIPISQSAKMKAVGKREWEVIVPVWLAKEMGMY